MPSLLIGLIAWLFSDTPVFDQIGPAILALFPFTIMFLITSIATLRERRSGTLERLLAMPIGKLDFILGYALAFGLLAILQATHRVSFAVWVCGLSIEGSIWLLLAVALADAILGTTLGLLASAFAQTEFQVVQFMPVAGVSADPARRNLPAPRGDAGRARGDFGLAAALARHRRAERGGRATSEDAAYVGGAAAHHRRIRRRLHRARLDHLADAARRST